MHGKAADKEKDGRGGKPTPATAAAASTASSSSAANTSTTTSSSGAAATTGNTNSSGGNGSTTERCGIRTFALLERSLGTLGLRGLDRLFAFRTVYEFTALLKFYDAEVRFSFFI